MKRDVQGYYKREGDVLFCYRGSLLSRLIRLATRSQYSHTAMILRIDGELKVVEAQRKGMHILSFEKWRKKYNYTFSVYTMEYHNQKENMPLVYHRFNTLGPSVGYDFASLFFYKPKFLITGKWSGKRYDKALNRVFCSELTAYLLGLNDYWKKSPKDVLNVLMSDKKWMHSGFFNY